MHTRCQLCAQVLRKCSDTFSLVPRHCGFLSVQSLLFRGPSASPASVLCLLLNLLRSGLGLLLHSLSIVLHFLPQFFCASLKGTLLRRLVGQNSRCLYSPHEEQAEVDTCQATRHVSTIVQLFPQAPHISIGTRSLLTNFGSAYYWDKDVNLQHVLRPDHETPSRPDRTRSHQSQILRQGQLLSWPQEV